MKFNALGNLYNCFINKNSKSQSPRNYYYIKKLFDKVIIIKDSKYSSYHYSKDICEKIHTARQ